MKEVALPELASDSASHSPRMRVFSSTLESQSLGVSLRLIPCLSVRVRRLLYLPLIKRHVFAECRYRLFCRLVSKKARHRATLSPCIFTFPSYLPSRSWWSAQLRSEILARFYGGIIPDHGVFLSQNIISPTYLHCWPDTGEKCWNELLCLHTIALHSRASSRVSLPLFSTWRTMANFS